MYMYSEMEMIGYYEWNWIFFYLKLGILIVTEAPVQMHLLFYRPMCA